MAPMDGLETRRPGWRPRWPAARFVSASAGAGNAQGPSRGPCPDRMLRLTRRDFHLGQLPPPDGRKVGVEILVHEGAPGAESPGIPCARSRGEGRCRWRPGRIACVSAWRSSFGSWKLTPRCSPRSPRGSLPEQGRRRPCRSNSFFHQRKSDMPGPRPNAIPERPAPTGPRGGWPVKRYARRNEEFGLGRPGLVAGSGLRWERSRDRSRIPGFP
jgi:hypothetical protein